MMLGPCCRRWLRHRRTDLRPDSIRTYRVHCQSLIRVHGPDLPVDMWDRDLCDLWWQQQSHLAARTLRHRLSVVHQWATWCVQHDWMTVDPTVTLPRVRTPRTVPRALTAGQVERLWRRCDQRTRLAVSLMVHEGLRRGEAARLDWSDIDRARATVTVDGKGGDRRMVPLSAATAALLDGERRQWGPVLRSRIDPSAPLTAGHVGDLVAAAMHAAGISGSPHALRHTAASDALDSGCPIRTVQQFLGHMTVATTEVYLRRDCGDLRAAVDHRPYRL